MQKFNRVIGEKSGTTAVAPSNGTEEDDGIVVQGIVQTQSGAPA